MSAVVPDGRPRVQSDSGWAADGTAVHPGDRILNPGIIRMGVRFVMVGGFLGAGKTTTLARLARAYQSRGQRVGLVTNDQAHDLVDTAALRAQGFSVQEVAGACFCCRFDDLVARVAELQVHERPDVIL